MKITKIDKKSIGSIKEEIREALKCLEVLGLEVKLGNTSYDSTSFKTDIKISIVGSDDDYAKDFKHNYMCFDIPLSTLKTTIMFNDEAHIFRGFKPKARKKICVIERLSDKSLRVTTVENIMKLNGTQGNATEQNGTERT